MLAGGSVSEEAARAWNEDPDREIAFLDRTGGRFVTGRTLIAGCGYVGLALARELSALPRPVPVVALRRDPAALGPLPPGVEPFAADLAHPRSLEALPTDLEAVVYAVSASERTDAGYRRAYVDGARHLLTMLARRGSGLRRFVYVSSTGVYEGLADGAEVDEATPVAPTDSTGHFTSRRLAEGEELVLARDLSATVVRFGGIYGPGRDRLLASVREGRARRRGPTSAGGPRWTNRIHRDDCAGVLAHVLAHDSPHALYVGVDDEPAPYDDVLVGLAAMLGVPPPPFADPDSDTDSDPEHSARAAFGRSERSNKRCRNRRLRADGYAFRYPTWREGYAALARGAT